MDRVAGSSLTTDRRPPAAGPNATDGEPLKVWPYRWRSIGKFLVAWVAMTAGWAAAGLALVTWFSPTEAGRTEVDVSRWLEGRRSDTLTTIAHIASWPADTVVVIVGLIVLAAVFPLLWRRWHDWAFLLSALVLEVSVYVSANLLVGRPRPPVDRLEVISTDSFPSGHMAAAVTLYLGLTTIIGWHSRRAAVRAAALAISVVLIAIVAVSRLYLGVHYPTDIVAGMVLGFVSVVVAKRIITTAVAGLDPDRAADLPAHVVRLDVSDVSDVEPVNSSL